MTEATRSQSTVSNGIVIQVPEIGQQVFYIRRGGATKVRNSCALILLLAVFAVAQPAKAQDDATKFEFYGGYDYIRFNVNSNVSGTPPFQTFNANGGGVQFEFNVSHLLGIVGDLAGYGVTNTSADLVGWVMPYLVGPRINFRSGKFTPFAETLFGGNLASNRIGGGPSQNSFAMTAGGGIDVNLSPHFSARPLQAEYFLTKIPDGLNNRQNNFRYSAGIVFRFGG